MDIIEILRRSFRSVVYRPFKSPDELWRKRTRWGEINEFFGHQIFASDDRGYNPPLLSNPTRERAEQNTWAKGEYLTYEYITPERQVWANRVFEFMYAMLEGRLKKDEVIFDVGCNTGYQLDNFHKRGHTNLWGIDPMKYAVEYGREKRPYINFVEGYFGPQENDVTCDLLICFGSIFRIPYVNKVFEAMDRCATKYVLIWVQEACDDLNRDLHLGLSKKGFICIEKHVVNDIAVGEEGDYIPIGVEGADGPMIEIGNREENTVTLRNFRSFSLFRRIEPRPPASRKRLERNRNRENEMP